jgi:hypothetical protein
VLNLRTGLKGYSDVTVKGSGTFQSSRYSMGIPRGRWKVEAGVDAQLHGAAAAVRVLAGDNTKEAKDNGDSSG